LNQTNFDQTVSKEILKQAKLAVKDEYTFDFLELGEEHSEREMGNKGGQAFLIGVIES